MLLRDILTVYSSLLLDGGLSCVSGGFPLLTNVTKVVKYSKASHSASAVAWRIRNNVVELLLIVCDYAIFAESVPSCEEANCDLFSNTTAVFNEFVS